MEDDHVDRPGVEAQQCVKLTGTNRSIGLNALINRCPSLALICFAPIGAADGQINRSETQKVITQFASFPPFAGLVTFAE